MIKQFSINRIIQYVSLSLLLLVFSCGGKSKPNPDPTPQPEVAKLTSVSLDLNPPKGKLDAVLAHEETTGITNQTSPTTVRLSANSVYTGTLTLKETKGTTTTTATSAYTISYTPTGGNMTVTSNMDTPTITTGAVGTGTLKITAAKNNVTHSVTFNVSVEN